MPLKELYITDFSTGINEYPSEKTKPNELVIADNVTVDDGLISKRRGYSSYITRPFLSTPLNAGIFRIPGYADRLIVAYPSPYGLKQWNTIDWLDITPEEGWTNVPDDIVTFYTYFNKLLIANGRDRLTAMAPTDSKAHQIANAPIAKYVVGWKDFVFVGNTIEGGDNFPTRVRWCKPSDIDTWAENAGGGYIDISPDDGDEIKGMAQLGNGVLIWKTKKLCALVPTSPPQTWTYREIATGIGLDATLSLLPLIDRCYFSSNKGFYVADISQLRPLSYKIYDSLLKIPAIDKKNSFSFQQVKNDSILFSIKNKGYLYNPINDSWVTSNYAHRPIAIVEGALGEDLDWENMPEEWGWEDLDWYWEAPPINAGEIIPILISDKDMYYYNTGFNDAGVDIDMRVKTKEFLDDVTSDKLLHYVFIRYETNGNTHLTLNVRINGREEIEATRRINLTPVSHRSKYQESVVGLNLPYNTFSLEITESSQYEVVIHGIGYGYSIRGRRHLFSRPTWGVNI